MNKTSRRLLILGGLAISSLAHAQPSGSPFVGRWKGNVRGLGDAEILVTAVRANGQVDGVYVIYNEFKSIMSQKTLVEQLLPIPRLEPAADSGPALDYLYEPDAATIFGKLLPRYVESRIFAALLESNAAFYAAQMTAMDSATKNSADMLESLTLYMNKVRQAAITREIIEVSSGASALGG